MSNFLNEFNELVDEGFHENACEMITALGSNAQRMLEIGIAQDELIKLGFRKETADYELEAGGCAFIEHFISLKTYTYYDEELDESVTSEFIVACHADLYMLFIEDNLIDSFGDLGDCINKVNELIK